MLTDPPKPFRELSLSQPVLEAVQAAGYEIPTDVQGGVIPLVLAGIDLIVQSQTGTGKTAAFGIPIAEMLDPNPGVVQALVLAPTRELALQVTEECRRVGCSARGLNLVTVYGGASIRDQINAVKKAEVIVATPGRMLDLLRRKATELSALRMFVLDEADEMLSMGFEKELEAILEFLPEDRQSLMFSATVTEDIKSVAAHTLFYPEFLSFSSDSLAAEEIEHYYYLIAGIGRLRDLHRLITFEEPENALVFCNTKDDSFRVANFLKQQGFDADVLNGDMPQSEREKVMGLMKAGKLRFLVATDVAARGIDISFLPCVINYVLPESAEAYIHRTGRTGRAGRSGAARSLVSPREIGMFYQLRRAYKLDLIARELPSEEELIRLRERRMLDRILEGLDENNDLSYGQYLTFADAFPNLPDYRARLAKLIAYFVNERDRQSKEAPAKAAEQAPAKAAEQAPAKAAEQAPAKAAKQAPAEAAEQAPAEAADELKKPQPPPGRPRRERARPEKKPEAVAKKEPADDAPEEVDEKQEKTAKPETAGDDMVPLRINVGKNKVSQAKKLREFIAELSGLELSDLGKAKLYRDHAWVDVRADYVDDVIAALDHERIDEHVLVVNR